jgi:sporulation protein YlmC with PRC-barrel domain
MAALPGCQTNMSVSEEGLLPPLETESLSRRKRMLRQKMMLALVGTALLTLPALGQGGMNQPAPGATGTQAQSGAAPASGQFVNQASPGQWRMSQLDGLDVYGQDNEKIGDIKDVLLDKSGNAQVVVIGVGGFLGIGEKNVAVPFNSVQWMDQPPPRQAGSGTGTTGTGTATTGAGPANRDRPDHAKVNMTKDQLQNAPEFRFAGDASGATGRTGSPPPAGSPPAGSPSR